MNPKVLLVVDGVADRRELAAAMAQNGCVVEQVGDGLAALLAVEGHARAGRPFHAVVADLDLPDMDGVKLLRVIKSRHPGIRVVVTASAPDAAAERAVTTHGGEALAVRPLDLERVVRMIDAGAGEVPVDVTVGGSHLSRAPAACVFVALAQGASAPEVLASLAGEGGVLFCDAVRDPRFSIVLFVRGATHAEASERVDALFAGRKGIAGYEVVRTEEPCLPDAIRLFLADYTRQNAEAVAAARTSDRATSYVVIDAAPADIPSLYARLYFLDEVVEIGASTDKDKLIVILQGADFSAVRRVTNGRVSLLHGVLRVHELKVVPFNLM